MTYGNDIRRELEPRFRIDDDADVYLRPFTFLAKGNGWDNLQ